MTAAATTTTSGGALKTSAGLTSYYQQKIEHLELTVRDKTQNLRRLQAQRNELNSKGTLRCLPSEERSALCVWDGHNGPCAYVYVCISRNP